MDLYNFISESSERHQKSRQINCTPMMSGGFSWFQQDFAKIHNLNPDYCNLASKTKRLTSNQEENLSILIVRLFQMVSVPKNSSHLVCFKRNINKHRKWNQNFQVGILMTLSKLSTLYPPSIYEICWLPIMTNEPEHCTLFLGYLLKIPAGNLLGSDLISVHRSIFTIIAQILAG